MEKINVPNPCSENWELMFPKEKGRFCSVCNKCVVDSRRCSCKKSGGS